jgi:hypothetical protein
MYSSAVGTNSAFFPSSIFRIVRDCDQLIVVSRVIELLHILRPISDGYLESFSLRQGVCVAVLWFPSTCNIFFVCIHCHLWEQCHRNSHANCMLSFCDDTSEPLLVRNFWRKVQVPVKMEDPRDAKRLDVSCECGASLPVVPVFCDVCENTTLCLSCSVEDIAMCNSCHRSQTDLRQLADKELLTVVACGKCQTVPAEKCDKCSATLCTVCEATPSAHTCIRCKSKADCFSLSEQKCDSCKAEYCAECVMDARAHPCIRCQNGGCFAMYERYCSCQICCNMRLCSTCMLRRHSDKYVCTGCKFVIEKIGSARFRCPIRGCERIYGCHLCCSFPGRSDTACYEHSSKDVRCSGCKQRYPLVAGHGVIRVRRLVGPQVRDCCECCFQKVRVLVECVKLHYGKRMPGEIVEMIILLVLERLT